MSAVENEQSTPPNGEADDSLVGDNSRKRQRVQDEDDDSDTKHGECLMLQHAQRGK